MRAIIIWLLVLANPVLAADVSLAWDASVTPGIVSHKVYYGNASHTYTQQITIGNQTTYTVSNLANGTYYFAVTALDNKGNESDFSNEVSTTIGPPPAPKSPLQNFKLKKGTSQ